MSKLHKQSNDAILESFEFEEEEDQNYISNGNIFDHEIGGDNVFKDS